MNKMIIIGIVCLLLLSGCKTTNIAILDPEALDFTTSCSLNLMANTDCLALSSNNPDVDDSGSREDIWEGGGLLPYLTTAQTLDIVSTHANDTLGGSGLNTLFVSCINDTGFVATEILNMNGTTPVETSIECFRPRFMAGVFGGDSEENAGTITATSSSSADLQMQMNPRDGLSKNSHFTVPTGQIATIKAIYFGATKTGGQSPIVQVKGKARFFGTNIWVQTFDFKLDTSVSDVFTLIQPISNELVARTDYRLEVTSSTDNTDVLARTYVVFSDIE